MPQMLYASPSFFFLVGRVGTGGRAAFFPLTAGFGVYGSSSPPQPSEVEQRAATAAMTEACRTFIEAPEGRPNGRKGYHGRARRVKRNPWPHPRWPGRRGALPPAARAPCSG